MRAQPVITTTKANEIAKKIRIQKLLAACGYGSRRAIDVLVQTGKIRINNRIARPGDAVCLTDRVYIHGALASIQQSLWSQNTPCQVLIYNKPPLQLCSRKDQADRAIVFDALPKYARQWIMIGRLDYMTSGLLLFTDSGDTAHRLMHPRFNIEREYLVRAAGSFTKQVAHAMCAGQMVDGEYLQIKAIVAHDSSGYNRWYQVTMNSGKNRAIRRLFAACGMTVSRLKRIRFGNVCLPKGLPLGRHALLDDTRLAKLINSGSR